MPGAGIVTVYYGRKKANRVWRFFFRGTNDSDSLPVIAGNHIPKAASRKLNGQAEQRAGVGPASTSSRESVNGDGA